MGCLTVFYTISYLVRGTDHGVPYTVFHISYLRPFKITPVVSSRWRPSCTTIYPINMSLSRTIQTRSGDTIKRAKRNTKTILNASSNAL